MKFKYLILLIGFIISGCRETSIISLSGDTNGSLSRNAADNSLTGTVNLTWAASMVKSTTVTSKAITYTVYRNGISLGTTTTTTYQDKTTLPGGGTYKYTIVAADAAGNMSTPSSPSSVTR